MPATGEIVEGGITEQTVSSPYLLTLPSLLYAFVGRARLESGDIMVESRRADMFLVLFVGTMGSALWVGILGTSPKEHGRCPPSSGEWPE